MCRIKAKGPNVTKCSDHLTVIGRTQRVATVFDQPQIMLFTQSRHHLDVKGVTETMRQHNSLRFGTYCRFNFAGVNIMSR